MELLPVELRKTLPSLYSQKSCPTPIAHAKLFTPDAGWTWFITEGSEEDRRRLAPIRVRDRFRRGVGLFLAVRNRKYSRPPWAGGGTGSVVSARSHCRSDSSQASIALWVAGVNENGGKIKDGMRSKLAGHEKCPGCWRIPYASSASRDSSCMLSVPEVKMEIPVKIIWQIAFIFWQRARTRERG